MTLFRKKKNEEDVKKVKEIVEERKIPEEIKEIINTRRKLEEVKTPKSIDESKPVEEVPVPRSTEVAKKTFAPLFVKIERYKFVLDAINDLKAMIIRMKNILQVQKQIEAMRDENRRLLESAVDKIDKKILSLDSELLRPRGYNEEFSPPMHETENLEGAVDDLKKQIEGLKSELKTIS